jgi:hypothetical protein
VCEPGASEVVSTFAVLSVPVTPSPVKLYTAFIFGFSMSAVAVTVTGSPGKTEVGLAEQASVTGGGGAIEPIWKPHRRSDELH